MVSSKIILSVKNNVEYLADGVVNTLCKRTTSSKFTFGTKKPLFTFGDIKSKKISFGNSVQGTDYSCLCGANPNIRWAQNRFYDATGLRLHCPTSTNIDSFIVGLQNIENSILYNGEIVGYCETAHRGLTKIPKNSKIKHVLIGHGFGSVEDNCWNFYHDRAGGVFDYINKNIPKGEQVIVLTCETGLRNHVKTAIGGEVMTLLTDSNAPAKIIESGKNEIIGSFTLSPFGNGIVYY